MTKAGLTGRILFKVIRMSTRRLCIAILLLVIGCQQAGISADKPALQSDEATAKAELDKQLKVNQDALLKGSSEQIRIDAATVMLFSENPLARKILLDALKQSENSAAQMAVCRALSQARAAQEPIKSKEDFIQPLLDILTTDDSAGAKLAAETTLLFEYERISKPLEKIATDPSLPVKARLNVIYALKLQPDMRAIFKLMELLDDPESQVAAESEKALRSLGIPVGKDAETRKQIIDGLKRKGRDEFLRDWLIRQESQMRTLETELDLWQRMYLDELDKRYDDIRDDAVKGQFLAEHLRSSKAIVISWALEKVSQWRVGTTSKLPAELGPILVDLISSPNREIRLKTAKLLSLMPDLNSAQRLLEQHKVEQDSEVRTELFVALGGACYYASLPNSALKISPEIRKQTLEWATEYLREQDAKKTQKGAEVMKKLLEQDGLTVTEVDKYLGLLVERYKQEKEGALRGELLGAMAGLCAQSVYKTEATRLFKPLFEEALRDEANLVREAAVDGLIYIDKSKALNRFRKDLANDSSIIVRKKLISLAGEVGGKEDLPWLTEKIGTTDEGKLAWQTMLEIFKRSDAAGLAEWVDKLDSPETKDKLSDEQKLSFLEMAEAKIVDENILKGVRRKLADLYTKTGELKRAVECLGKLREAVRTDEEKEAILAELLNVYLKWPNVDAAAQLVVYSLLEKDLEPNNVVVLSIDRYFNKPPAGTDPNAVLKALVKIKTPQNRPMWQQQVKYWADRLGWGAQLGRPGETK
jgi:HEAT repeat protein